MVNLDHFAVLLLRLQSMFKTINVLLKKFDAETILCEEEKIIEFIDLKKMIHIKKRCFLSSFHPSSVQFFCFCFFTIVVLTFKSIYCLDKPQRFKTQTFPPKTSYHSELPYLSDWHSLRLNQDMNALFLVYPLKA